MSSSSPARTSSTVRATSAAEGVGSPEGWLWTATIAVALWRMASRKTSVLRRKRASKRKRTGERGTARQAQRAAIFLGHESASARRDTFATGAVGAIARDARREIG